MYISYEINTDDNKKISKLLCIFFWSDGPKTKQVSDDKILQVLFLYSPECDMITGKC